MRRCRGRRTTDSHMVLHPTPESLFPGKTRRVLFDRSELGSGSGAREARGWNRIGIRELIRKVFGDISRASRVCAAVLIFVFFPDKDSVSSDAVTSCESHRSTGADRCVRHFRQRADAGQPSHGSGASPPFSGMTPSGACTPTTRRRAPRRCAGSPAASPDSTPSPLWRLTFRRIARATCSHFPPIRTGPGGCPRSSTRFG